MLKLFYNLFGEEYSYTFATILDAIKNYGIAYLLAVFVAWDFNPANWSAFESTAGRIGLLVYFLVITIITFHSND